MTLRCLVAILGIAFAGVEAAENFPARPIHIVVPAPAGGPLDYRIRLIAEKLSPSLGQPIVIDNRPGAAGVLAAGQVAQAKPDGYALFFGHAGTHSFAPHVQAQIPYDPVKDFAPVALVTFASMYLYAPAASPAHTVRDLGAAARAKPGTMTYGSVGVGSPSHVAMEWFKRMAGIDLVHVPYKGSAPLVTAMLGGEVDVAFDAFVPAMEHVKSGKLRVLGTTRARRWPAFPGIPTIAESGMPGFELRIWTGIFAPAGTPNAIVARLNREFVRALSLPDIATKLRETGSESEPLTPDQFAALVRDEWVTGKRLVEISGARQE